VCRRRKTVPLGKPSDLNKKLLLDHFPTLRKCCGYGLGVYPGSGFFPSRIPESKKAPDPDPQQLSIIDQDQVFIIITRIRYNYQY
jgi:hypothetical protein